MTSQVPSSSTNGNEYHDILTYPILTQDVDDTLIVSGGRMGDGENARIVSNAIRDILGWQPRRTDPRGFVAALNGAFTAETVEGYTTWKWQPRAYSIDAGMGEITGAQATVYQQARVILREIEPLLDGLEPLISDADAEDVHASREIIRSTLVNLVDELGAVGGPRVNKVDSYFMILVSRDLDEAIAEPEKVGGELGRLRKRLGLKSRRVNTISEERILTNFLSVVNYVFMLLINWGQNRDYFTGNGPVFLGTHLVLLSQALEVVASSVEQVRGALRSVFLSDADQQAILLFEDSGDRLATISLAGLLDWIEDAATVEWPHLIRESGKDGVAAIRPPLRELKKMVKKTVDLSEGSDNIPDAFFSRRVQSALGELLGHLKSAQALAKDITGRPRSKVVKEGAETVSGDPQAQTTEDASVIPPATAPKTASTSRSRSKTARGSDATTATDPDATSGGED